MRPLPRPRWCLAVPLAVALLGVPTGVLLPVPPSRAAAGPLVQVYPRPGSGTVAPGSQISFRGIAQLPAVQVRGSVSGLHPGHVLEHSDAAGASFVPDRPFRPGEQVTVTTPLHVAGATGDTFSYTVSRPVAVAPTRPLEAGEGAAAPVGPVASAVPGAGPYRSRPDLRPPPVTVTSSGPHAAGLLFASSGVQTASADTGVLIYDDGGEPVWFDPLPPTGLGTLSRIRYRGQDALTWFTGTQAFVGGFKGSWVVVDSSYRQIGEIAAGNGLTADGHELRISPDGTKALLDVYDPVQLDLRRYGGLRDATVYEAVVQEIDLATGAVTFEWHSLDDSPVTDTYESLTTPEVDYFHLNSMDYDAGGRILLSGRHVSQALELTRDAGGGGNVAWRLGGRRSTYRFDHPGDAPSYPHDVRRRPDGTISLYDNGVQRARPRGRGVAYRLDEAHRSAHLARTWEHAPDVFGPIVGSNRLLDGGDELVSYGSTGVATEYAPGGRRVWESRLGDGAWTYRTLRVAGWHAEPAEAPALATDRRGDDVTGFVSWNGATDVASWTLLAGPSPDALRPVGATTRRSGFETRLTGTLRPGDTLVVAQARDAAGRELRRSSGADTGTPVQAHYNALGGAAGFLGAPATPETTLPEGSYQGYQHGAIYYSASTRAWEVHGDIQAEWDRVGAQAGVLGYPLTDEQALPDGVGRASLFAGGTVTWTAATGAHEVHGLIQAAWSASGSQSGALGYPLTDELPTLDGAGRVNLFQNGGIYFSATGTWAVRGAVRDAWYRLGAETGPLGYPTSDEEPTRAGGGRVSRFVEGAVHFSPDSGAYGVQGLIEQRYRALREEAGPLGFPVTDEQGTPDGAGRYSVFQGGSIYWTGATGAHEVRGAILAAWAARGFEAGPLGYPVSGEHAVRGGRRSDFEHGSLVWDAATGEVTQVG